MSEDGAVLTAYEVLGVHPAAPADLISACYWLVTKELQVRRASDPRIDQILHYVTRAYETVADPVRRAGYDLAIGNGREPLSRRPLPRRPSLWRRLFSRNTLSLDIDPYEVLGLEPTAMTAAIPEGYRVMRDQYLRLPESRRRMVLLRLADESFALLSDPERRALLDAERRPRKAEPQHATPEGTPEASDEQSGDPDEPETSVQEAPEAKDPPAPSPVAPVAPEVIAASSMHLRDVAAAPSPSASVEKGPSPLRRAVSLLWAILARTASAGAWLAVRTARLVRGGASAAYTRAGALLSARSESAESPARAPRPSPIVRNVRARKAAERDDPDERFLERLALTVQEVDATQGSAPKKRAARRSS